MRTNKNTTVNDQPRLIDILDDKSLEVLSKFGHIFIGPKSGKKHIRPYKNILNNNVINNTNFRQTN